MKENLTEKTERLVGEVRGHLAAIAKLEGSLKYAQDGQAGAWAAKAAAEAEVEQIHCVLDALPTSPARTNEETDRWGTVSRVERKVMTRLAAYFATCRSAV
jgi:hypothetical protein